MIFPEPTVNRSRPGFRAHLVAIAAIAAIWGLLSVVGVAAADGGKDGKPAADAPTPEPDVSWMEDVTLIPPGSGNAEPIRPCRLTYKLSWRKVLSAGEATVEIKQSSPSVLFGEATAKSSGLARALFSYDCDLSTEVDSQTLKPLGFEHSEVEKKGKKSYVTEFTPRWVRTYTTETDDKGEKKTVKRTYKYGEALDLLSTMLYVRSMPLAKGDKVTRVVQPFDRPYLVSFTVEGREERKFDGKKIPTIKLSVTILRVNKDLSLKSYDKMKESTVWVSDDEFRLPIEIRADIFIGYITCLLKSREYTDIVAKGQADAAAAGNSKAKPGGTERVPASGGKTLGSQLKALGERLRLGGD